jgi:hypothetical protein
VRGIRHVVDALRKFGFDVYVSPQAKALLSTFLR